MHLVGNVETLQQNRRVTFGGVAVFLADNAFKFAELHAVGVGHLMLGVDKFALFQRGPQAPVAHDDRIDHAILVKGKLILAQNAQLARTDNCSLLRLQFAGQKFHECRFAGAVRASQAVALARDKSGGYFVKQNFSAVAHRHIAD